MPGPQRTATAELKARGSRYVRQRDNEPQYDDSRGDMCPGWLTSEARVEWDRIVPILLAAGVFTVADRSVVAAYCQSLADYQVATVALTAEGTIVETKKGERRRNPLTTVQRDARTAMLRYIQELGLSPASRSKVQARSVEKNDPTEKFLSPRIVS